MNVWHASSQDLVDFRTGEVGTVLAASIEAHLLKCAECRASLASLADPGSKAGSRRRWAALASEVDRLRQNPLGRLGVASSPLRQAFTVAVLLVLVVPILPVFFLGVGVPTPLLALAPIAPGLAVAAAYRVAADPSGEISLASPMAGLRLISARALLVSIGAMPLGIAIAVLPGIPLSAALS